MFDFGSKPKEFQGRFAGVFEAPSILLIYLGPIFVVRSPSQLNEDIFRKLLKVRNLSINSWSVVKIGCSFIGGHQHKEYLFIPFYYVTCSTVPLFLEKKHHSLSQRRLVQLFLSIRILWFRSKLGTPEVLQRKRGQFNVYISLLRTKKLTPQYYSRIRCYCDPIGAPCSSTWNVWGTIPGTPLQTTLHI